VLVCACGGRSDAPPTSGDDDALTASSGESAPAEGSDESAPDHGGSEDAPGSAATAPANPPQRIIEVGVLTNSPPPASCLEGLPAFLPNCTPGIGGPLRGLDCDGDAVLDYQVFNCDVSTAERPPYFGGSFDCAPDDPGLRHWVLRDGDGDGMGSGTPLCAGPDVPLGYVASALDSQDDCDDGNAHVHPGAPDVWGDGADSDCFNDDLPVCTGLAPDMDVERAPIGLGTCPDGPDIYLSRIAVCGGRCNNGGSLFGYVGNSGSRELAGPLEVHFRDSTGAEGSLQLDVGQLAPGAASSLFEVPYGLVTRVEVWIDSGDCAAGNDRFVHLNPNGDQICLL
jgi:hypothetical protein